ncbi:hypothetical protein Tco_1305793, partial [Tanacetum coccineum]
LQKQVLDLEKAKSDQAIEIASLKKREDASKQRTRIEDINADAEVTLVNETQERQDEDLMFDTRVLDDDEVCVDVTTIKKEEQSTKTGEAVTTAGVEDSVAPIIPITAGVEDSAAPTIPTAVEETLAQTLMEIKVAKPKAKGIVFHDLEKYVSKPTVSVTQPSIKDIGKAIMQEPERPLTKKDQVALDEDLARNIQAQLDTEIIEEERLERQKQEEANIALIESWENIQAMIEADRLLAKRLQTREREELTDEEKGKMFMELMEKRRKHFAALRAQEKRNRPPTKAQKRNKMSTYLKYMGGYTYKQLMGKSCDEIQKLFDKDMKRVNTFVAMSSEAQESNEKKVEGSEEKAKSSRKKSLGKKRAIKEHQQESPKRQKLGDDKETDEHEEVEADDTAKLKKHLVIKKDDDIAIDAIPLATKPPMIVEYKLLKEGIMVHFQLIRADGSSKRYSSMIRMLQDIDREDLETLWKLVKTKHGDLRPKDEHERVLWGDFKVMFKPDIRSKVWRDLQGYTVSVWKLYDSCGVHFVRFGNVHIFMLVEKRYPLTPITITNMLNKKLQTDHWNEMCYQLLKLMTVEEIMLPRIHHPFLLWEGYSQAAKSQYSTGLAQSLPRYIYSSFVVDWNVLNHMGCGEEFDEVCADDELRTKKIIKFRIYRHAFSWTLLDFVKRLGLYHSEEIEEEGFDVYFQGGLAGMSTSTLESIR